MREEAFAITRPVDTARESEVEHARTAGRLLVIVPDSEEAESITLDAGGSTKVGAETVNYELSQMLFKVKSKKVRRSR